MYWYLQALRKYAVFSGRARRKEYWLFVLIDAIISFALGLPAYLTADESILTIVSSVVLLYSLAMMLPSLTVTVRRLHDTNRSGWNILWSLVPLLGGILVLVWTLTDSDAGENRYGPDPKTVWPMARPGLPA